METMYKATAFIALLLLGSHHVEGNMSCLQARAHCYTEARCNSILSMHHKICGPELAACSTVTPVKCQQLLLSLRSFDYISNCRCTETHIEYSCYTFRQSIFEHPCSMVNLTGTSSTGMARSIEAKHVLQTCNDAQKECAKDRHQCFKNFMEFKKYCEYRGDTCVSQNNIECNKSWLKVRLSPVFGCICPNKPLAMMSMSKYGTFNKNSPDQIRRTSIHELNNAAHSNDQCMEIFNITHNNPCLRNDKPMTTTIEEVQELCHMSLEACEQDEECSPMLERVMMWCEHSHCEADRCRGALQNFYDSVSIQRRLEVAFCVCRQNDNDGECLTAMRTLHPSCAERHMGSDPKQCHEIARQCRDSENCRKKLETYETHCAADSITGQCSGDYRDCQHAVTNILGTELHASCVCKGTDFLHLHDCYSFHRLLWSNQCVIDSHLALQEEIRSGADLDEVFTRAPQTTSTPYSTSTSTMRPDNQYYGQEYHSPDGSPYPTNDDRIDESPYRGGGGIRTGGGLRPKDRDGPPRRWGNQHNSNWPGDRGKTYRGRPQNNLRQRDPNSTGRIPTRTQRPPNNDGLSPYERNGGNMRSMNNNVGRMAGADYANSNTTEACLMKEEVEGKTVRTWEIPVNSSIRRMRDAGCSDICQCRKTDVDKQPTVLCQSIACIQLKGCTTNKAVYPHNAPFIQAFRGQCICYSGKFICQRPAPDQFKEGPGVYLFLGYSRDEMEIMKPYTLMNEIQALKAIEKLLRDRYGFKCKLIMKEQIDQNLILMPELVEVPEDGNEDSYRKHRQQMEECTRPLEQLANWINQRPRDLNIHSDAYLSMFILAEVHVNISEAQASQLSVAVKLVTTAATRALTTAVVTVPMSVCLYWSWALTHGDVVVM